MRSLLIKYRAIPALNAVDMLHTDFRAAVFAPVRTAFQAAKRCKATQSRALLDTSPGRDQDGHSALWHAKLYLQDKGGLVQRFLQKHGVER